MLFLGFEQLSIQCLRLSGLLGNARLELIELRIVLLTAFQGQSELADLFILLLHGWLARLHAGSQLLNEILAPVRFELEHFVLLFEFLGVFHHFMVHLLLVGFQRAVASLLQLTAIG